MLYLKSISHKSLKSLYSVISPHHLYLRLFILFLPFALSLAPLASAASAATLTLGWDPNTEPDLEGYGVYQSEGSSGPPYELIEDLPENNLADPLKPEVTITGLNEGIKYYIATTAYNTAGTESDFSNEVCVQISEDSVGICSESISPGSGNNSGSGGGSGGCFISSSANGSSSNLQVSFLRKLISHALAIIFLLLLVIRSCSTPLHLMPSAFRITPKVFCLISHYSVLSFISTILRPLSLYLRPY